MKIRSIVVTDADMDRLSRLIRALQHSLFRDQPQLDSLDQALQNAEVRPPNRIPKSIVRMNFSIRVRDCDTQKAEVYTLAFPDDANMSRGRISVLAPVGIALLGRRKGDLIKVRVPGGIRRLRIEQVKHGRDALNRKFPIDRPIKQLNLSQQTGLAA